VEEDLTEEVPVEEDLTEEDQLEGYATYRN